MLGRVAFITRKEFYYFWLDRESYFWVFLMPVVFMYFIGTVTSQFGGSGSGDQPEVFAVVVPENAGFLGDQIVQRLEQSGYRVQRHETVDSARGYSRRLILPTGFTEMALGGEKAVVTLENSGEGLADDYVRFRVSRAVYTVLADLVVCGNQDRPPDAEAFEQLAEMPRSVTLDVKSAGQRKRIPTGYEQAVPGIMIMFSLIIILTSTSSTLVIERESGLLRRLASAPISRGEIFLGRWIARLGIGYIQVLICLIAGTVLFGVDWGPSLWMILIVLFAWSAVCASLGILLGNLVHSEGQGIGIGVLSANVLCAFGGQWWPIEVAPTWMQSTAKCLPNGWTMDALHQLSLFGAGPAAVVPHLVALLIIATVVAALGMRTFRFQ
jgi:ABC-type Na+ efflux pump permease subunit